MLLQLKAKLYQYTGIYLASREENEYMHSEEFAKLVEEELKSPQLDFTLRDVFGLYASLWQAKYGFYRRWSTFSYKQPSWFYKSLEWFHVFYLQLKGDMTRTGKSVEELVQDLEKK